MFVKDFFKCLFLSLILAFVGTLVITYVQDIPFYNYYEQNYKDTIHSGTMSSKYPSGIPTGYIDAGGDKNKYFDDNVGTYYVIFGILFVFFFLVVWFIIKFANEHDYKVKYKLMKKAIEEDRKKDDDI